MRQPLRNKGEEKKLGKQRPKEKERTRDVCSPPTLKNFLL
jgi:hypothetical protein